MIIATNQSCELKGREITMYKDKKGLYRESVMIDGKRKVFSGKRKQDVMIKILEYKREANTLPTLEKVADAWQEEHWKQVREGSLRSYTAPLRRIVERFGSKPINDIAPKEMQQYKIGRAHV